MMMEAHRDARQEATAGHRSQADSCGSSAVDCEHVRAPCAYRHASTAVESVQLTPAAATRLGILEEPDATATFCCPPGFLRHLVLVRSRRAVLSTSEYVM